MDSNAKPKDVPLVDLLLKLHHDEMSGVVSVKDERKAIRFYLKKGHIVYADGIDKDSQLLREIAAKRSLSQAQLDELKVIREKDPQQLGKVLIDQKLINQATWSKFLELKVRAVLAAALEMETADLGFSKSELSIPPINFIDCNLIQLLLDTIRGMKGIDQLKRLIPGEDAVFSPSKTVEEQKKGLPLSPSEQKVLSAVDGMKAVSQITQTAGLDMDGAYRILYLLYCFGLISPSSGEGKKRAGEDYDEIITLYLDLLGIVETNFQKEVGKEYDRIFEKCRDELSGDSKELFQGLRLSKKEQEFIKKEISKRFASLPKVTEGRLILLSSLNKLLYLLVMRMRKVLGVGLAEKTLNEMTSILDYVEKYREDSEMMNYVRGNLKDYIRQIKS